MGEVAQPPYLARNIAPSVSPSCYPIVGEGSASVRTGPADSSAFSFIDRSIRSVDLREDEDQLLIIEDASALAPRGRDMTVSIWVRLAPKFFGIDTTWIAGHGRETSNRVGWSIFATRGALYFRVNEGGSRRAERKYDIELMDDSWHHIAMVIDRSGTNRLRTYVDGRERGYADDDDTLRSGNVRPGNNVPITLGVREERNGERSREMDGYLDGFALWHAALTPEAIRGIYEGARSARNRPQLAASVCPNAGGSPSDGGGNSRAPPPPPPPPPPAFDAVGDPCRCTQDGLSGETFVYAVGCTIQIGPMYYCYVQEPASCPTAEPSNRFQGAAYRNC